MNTFAFIVAMVAIALIAFVAYIRYKKEQPSNPDELRFPSGNLVPKDEELLKLGIPEINSMPWCDIFWILDYAVKKGAAGQTEEERTAWDNLYDRVADVCFGQP